MLRGLIERDRKLLGLLSQTAYAAVLRTFMDNLLSWVHPGFSVFAGPPVDGAALASLQSQGRYITRPALAMNALRKLEDGPLSLETPPEPRTGASTITLDPLEWIHRLTAHVPDPGRNLISIYIQGGKGKSPHKHFYPGGQCEMAAGRTEEGRRSREQAARCRVRSGY